MKSCNVFVAVMALLWMPRAFAQLTIIQDKEGHSKIALKLPESTIVPAASLVKMVTLPDAIHKPRPVHLDLEGQYQQLRESCPLQKAEKPSMHLTGERKSTALVGLTWETTNGINNYQFEVQRSLADTTHFEVVNYVWAINISGFKDRYRLPDANGYEHISYYRLRVILRNGDVAYSNIAAVKGYNQRSFLVYPNPATSVVTIQYLAKEGGEALIKIYDATGRLIIEETAEMKKGVNRKNIPVSRLLKGTYSIQLKYPDQCEEVSKFIKG